MIAAYYDTAYLLKLYWPEPGADLVRAHAATIDTLVCSLHGRAELIAAAHRKVREGTATLTHVEALLEQVASDQTAGALNWLPITELHLNRVTEVFRHAPGTVYLRAADALHLASAAEEGFNEIYSNDRHLLAAAPLFGLRGVDVIVA
ncbi:type II toxin-antitoxin system VapC family toxin [Geminisphaera colitermitum]|uniref:type II toxin-antitoxin system VapC family toxin n=1 Tax=Geminisphaera colitermitum TaxID=1148786 RepID=UPI000158CC1C|nr:type II toxin-antitoxin system VapC family toxin [Geminisphaera colitermitum]